MRYEDTEFDPATDADREAAAREAELARKIRREVLRVQRGEADDDLRADREAEQEQRAEQERAARMERRRKSSFLWLLFSGNILVRESFSGYYRYLIYMAVTFFVSIFVMFTALHLDMKYTRLEREVQLLRERSVRLQEQSFRSTTHSGRRARARGARHSVVRSGRSGRNHRRVTMPQPKENSPIKRDILFRVHLLYAAFVLIAALVFARLIWVQLFSSEVAYNAERLEGRIFTDEIIPARRGNILTRDGEPLATSLFRYQVEMDYGSPGFDSLRTFREQSDSLAKLLALYFRDKSAAAYAQAMQREHARRYRVTYRKDTLVPRSEGGLAAGGTGCGARSS